MAARSSRLTPDSAWSAATIALLAGVLMLAIVRAVTFSVTCDEALTYNTFLSDGWRGLLLYGANNHVLFSWLAKASITLFGLSAWSLRLPSLAAAALYLGCTGSIALRWFRGGWRLLVAALLAINPLVMDYLVAARGYGLACALLLLMEALVLIEVEAPEPASDSPTATNPTPAPHRRAVWRRRAISALAALVVTANLAFAPAAAALVSVCLWRGRGRHWMQLVMPGALLAAVLLGPYLLQFNRSRIQVGFGSPTYTAIDLFDGSLRHDLLGQTSLTQEIRRSHAPAGAGTASGAAAVTAAALLLAWCVMRCPWGARECGAAAGAAMALAGAVALLVLLHFVQHLPYPVSRTGLYLLPMGTLAALLLVVQSPALVRRVAAVAGLIVVVIYARQLNSCCFEYARYDAGAARLFAALNADARTHFRASATARVGGTWIYEPAVNFYRVLDRADWMQPMQRDYGTPQPRQYDYFLVNPADDPTLHCSDYRVVAADPISGTVLLAVPSSTLTAAR